MVTLVLYFTLAAAALGEPHAPPPSPSESGRSVRVRAVDSRSSDLLLQGLQRSDTIRRLLTQLEQREVIVYVEMQPSLRRRLAGTLRWVAKTPAHRYVRISLNPELSTDLAIATLGHELQHALEVANAPEVVCDQTLERFYRTHGNSTSHVPSGWDTEAARLTGEDVRRELVLARSSRVADSIHPVDPKEWLNVYRRTRGMLPP